MKSVSRETYLALAFAFAGRWFQLYNELPEGRAKSAMLTAATFALDRTVPEEELALKIQFRQTDDPVQFLIQSQNVIHPVLREDWRSVPGSLRKSLQGPMIVAMDALLQGQPLPTARKAYVLEWLKPFLSTAPTIAATVETALTSTESVGEPA